MFMGYLTKWPAVFPTKDKTAPTKAKLLMEETICHHGVPVALLSDREPSFSSGLMQEVYAVMGTHKVNNTGYHPQTDGLVDQTFIDMIAKSTDPGERDRDIRLSLLLFANRATPQVSTGEPPFLLL